MNPFEKRLLLYQINCSLKIPIHFYSFSSRTLPVFRHFSPLILKNKKRIYRIIRRDGREVLCNKVLLHLSSQVKFLPPLYRKPTVPWASSKQHGQQDKEGVLYSSLGRPLPGVLHCTKPQKAQQNYLEDTMKIMKR